MRFAPKSEQEIASENLLQPGIYGFEIMEATEETSKAGNDMIKLKVHVFSDDGTPTMVFDYLMEQVAYKLRHAAEVCGLMRDYEKGELDALDLQGKTGRCKVVIQKDKTGQYADRNAIMDYVRAVAAADVAPVRARPKDGNTTYPRVNIGPPGKVGIVDDEIPF